MFVARRDDELVFEGANRSLLPLLFTLAEHQRIEPQRMEIIERQASQRVGEVVANAGRELTLTAWVIERHVKRSLLVLRPFSNDDVDLRRALFAQHLETLMTADHAAGRFIDDYRLNKAEPFYGCASASLGHLEIERGF